MASRVTPPTVSEDAGTSGAVGTGSLLDVVIRFRAEPFWHRCYYSAITWSGNWRVFSSDVTRQRKNKV
ncbi:MAG: hypothetical protein WC015_00760, partial [Methanoregula sp.]